VQIGAVTLFFIVILAVVLLAQASLAGTDGQV
jgi:hypothetical protein